MYERHITGQILASLSDTPVTILLGARQTGKSTLAQELRADGKLDDYVSLDDPVVAAAASEDPVGFVRRLPERVALDEVQSVPGLLPVIKLSVDRDRRPGRFLLTGSANLFTLPGVSESLAGRMQLVTLWPLSQGEIDGVRETFLDDLFSPAPVVGPSGAGGEAIVGRIVRGGFPDAIDRSAGRRSAWFQSFVTGLLQRDVRDLSRVERLGDVGRLMRMIAARAPATLNIAEISRDLAVPASTVQRHLALLEQLFLITLAPAWHANLSQRLIKSPKALVLDSGLHADLQGVGSARMEKERQRLGPLLEGFVGMELVKQASWHAAPRRLHHFRTVRGAEIDYVVEDESGRVAAVEVKSAASVNGADFRAMRDLAERIGERFVRGVILYDGDSPVSFSDRLAAWPIASLWSGERSWAIASGPQQLARPGLDAEAWLWTLEGRGGQRPVEVRISRTALAVDPESLPAFAREARRTHGRNVVEELARRAGEPPDVIDVSTMSRSPRI